jgi:hypothetical protein
LVYERSGPAMAAHAALRTVRLLLGIRPRRARRKRAGG